MTGSLMIQSGEGRNQPTTTFSLAVQPDLVGATQMVEASFASTNNNSAPRFGVVVRYQNPQNYYICYRQVGGSSVLRIAKVQNGVETVLKSVGIANPAAQCLLHALVPGEREYPDAAHRRRGEALDEQWHLHHRECRLHDLDPKGSSHRAENFSATAQ